MKTEYSGTKKQSDFDIDSCKCLVDYVGKETDDYVSVDHPIKSKFCKRIKEIQTAAAKHGLSDSDALQMINKNFGWTWNRIPYGRMSDMKFFVTSNAHRYLKMFRPDLHTAYMDAVPHYKSHFDYKEEQINRGNYDDERSENDFN
jgi:hypothetical protein